LRFAQSTISAIVLGGNAGFATTTCGVSTSFVMPARSRDGRGARAVLHYERLAKRFLQLGGEVARDDVRHPAGPVGHEDLHRPARVVRRLARDGERQQRRDDGTCRSESTHERSS
jgi:hypothetical protein